MKELLAEFGFLRLSKKLLAVEVGAWDI